MKPNQISRRAFTGNNVAAIVAGSFSGYLVGCNNEKTKPSSSEPTSATSQVSSTPLQVHIIAPISQIEVVVRQWRSVSDQPIEISSKSVDALLKEDKCAADLLIYPSRLIGDLIKRQWITKLPKALDELTKLDPTKHDEESPFAIIPQSMLKAGAIGSNSYGLPLGYSMVSLLGSATMTNNELSRDEFQALLGTSEPTAVEFEDGLVDAEALVDRFLYLAFGESEVNSKYGVLFELRTMKSRIAASEFVSAAKTLQRMAMQPQAVESVVGSHTVAWRWINETDKPAVALASASQLDLDSLALDNAKLLTISSARPWNSGSGMLASITMNCRQSAQSVKFILWLAQQNSLTNLRGLVPGLVSPVARGRTLSEKVVSANQLALQLDGTSCEPRCTATHQLRTALAANLIQFLRGQSSVDDVLSATAARWDSIIKQSSANPKADYERSLGLKE